MVVTVVAGNLTVAKEFNSISWVNSSGRSVIEESARTSAEHDQAGMKQSVDKGK